MQEIIDLCEWLIKTRRDALGYDRGWIDALNRVITEAQKLQEREPVALPEVTKINAPAVGCEHPAISDGYPEILEAALDFLNWAPQTKDYVLLLGLGGATVDENSNPVAGYNQRRARLSRATRRACAKIREKEYESR